MGLEECRTVIAVVPSSQDDLGGQGGPSTSAGRSAYEEIELAPSDLQKTVRCILIYSRHAMTALTAQQRVGGSLTHA